MDILVFSPHPDDCEIACGGTILLSVKQGMEVAVADMSEGECSSRGSPEERKTEKDKATGLLGIQERVSLCMPDTQIGSLPPHRSVVIDLIRKVRPRIILAPYREDRHPDHEAAGRLIREACFYAGVASMGRGEPFRPDRVYYYMSHSPFAPSFVIDITSVWEQKIAVINAYMTQFFNEDPETKPTAISNPEFLRYHEARSVYYGAMIGVSHGEPFFSVGPISLHALPGIERPRSPDGWPPSYKCF